MKNFLFFALFLSVFTCLAQTTQPGLRVSEELWGTTIAGGANGQGTIYKINPNNNNQIDLIHAFTPTTGRNPNGNILQVGGKFYGFTEYGGANDKGVIFQLDTAGTGYSVRHHFNGSNGNRPSTSPVLLNGKLYGVSLNGGVHDHGCLFEFDPTGAGSFVLKRSFHEPTGSAPLGFLLPYNGKLYGMTYLGGNHYNGVIYEFNPAGAGTYTILHHFNSPTGNTPLGNSLHIVDGKLFGMTSYGGNSGGGVLFSYNLMTNTYTVHHHFTSSTGINPFRGLLHHNGILYGLTYAGGSNNRGVIFKYDINGGSGYSVLRHFVNSNGSQPISTLIFKDGYLYGTTQYGGASNNGVVFRTPITTAGSIEVLHSFNGLYGTRPYGYVTPVVTPCSFSGWQITTSPSCGSNTGSISIAHNMTSGVSYEYSINNGTTYQSNALFQNLAVGTYLVRARESHSEGCVSDVATVVVSSVAATCSRPDWIQATSIQATSATIKWAKNCDASGYIFRYRPLSSVAHSWITLPVTTSDSVVIQGLCFNASYSIQVRAVCPSGSTPYRSSTFETLNIPTCTNPYFTVANSTSTNISLSWASIPSSTSQQLQYRMVGTTAYTSIIVPAGTTTATISNLLPNTDYQYRIRVRCGTTWLAYTKVNLIRTLVPVSSPADSREVLVEKDAVKSVSSKLFLSHSPNPSQGLVYVETNLVGEKRYELFNEQGQLITTWMDSTFGFEQSFDALPNGFYVLVAKNDIGQSVQTKIIISRK